MNFMNGVLKRDGDDYIVDLQAFRLKVPEEKVQKHPKSRNTSTNRLSSASGRRTSTDAQLLPEEERRQVVTAQVAVTEPMGSEVYVHFEAGEHRFIGRLGTATAARAGQSHPVVFDLAKMHLFDAATEKAIR